MSVMYYYRVRAYNGEGNSGYSNELNAKISYGSMVGNIAVDFSARDQINRTVSLYQYSGQVILINFGADT